MSDYKECVCADDEIMFVNSHLFRHHEVLSHMLGITNDFSPPETDDEGRLLFLKNFNIPRDDFAQCQVFPRIGTRTVRRNNSKYLFHIWRLRIF